MPAPFNPNPRCDICLADAPAWELRCEQFVIFDREAKVDHKDDGRWAICDTCKPLIEARDIEGLIQRATDHMYRAPRVGGLMRLDGYRRMARVLHKTLLDNLICGPFPMDTHCEGCTCESRDATVGG